MKIAYVNFVKDSSPGVAKRIHAMASGALQAGIDDIDFFFLNRSASERKGHLYSIKINEAVFPVNYYQFLFRRYRLIQNITSLSEYDYIILRYLNGDPSGVKFALSHNLITEHHSFEIAEYEAQLKNRMRLPVRLLKNLRLSLEKQYGNNILRSVKGIIGVTEEIRQLETSRNDRMTPSTVIRNGISVKNVPLTAFQPFDGSVLKLGMVAGTFSPWHGIDRLIRSLKNYSGGVKIELHLIGNVDQKIKKQKCSNDRLSIIFHGPCYHEELDSILSKMNLGVGTLGLFEIGMDEACTLKTREYVARGLPFVIGYKDGDLVEMGPKKRFYFSCENKPSLLPIDEIIDFARDVTARGIKYTSEYMRCYACKYLDWQIKIKQYVDFVKSL